MLLASDDLEDPATPSLWTVGGATDTASRGMWEWAAPHGTHAGDVIFGLTIGAPGFDRTPGEGSRAFVTGDVLSSSITLDEVSGGVTTLTSPSYDLSGTYGVRIHWHRWFRNDSADPGDRMVTEVSADGGTNWIEVDALTASTSTADASPAWAPASILLDEFVAPGPDVRIRFRVNDDSTDHVVEGAVDDLEIRGFAEATQGQVDGVRLDGAAATRLEWEPVGGAAGAVYDVARGDLASLAGGAEGVDLGPLVCVEDDSVDRSTAGDEDTETPEPGEGFFYLVRFQLGFSTGEWGRGSEEGVRNGSGGCLP
jgi:hypothetical protein